MDKKLYILVGVAGVGKSTFLKKHKEIKVFSSDEYRKKMYGSLEEGNKHNNEVFNQLHKDLLNKENFLEKEVALDATNLNRRRRRNLYSQVKKIDNEIKVIVVYFHSPLKEIIKRNRNREGFEKVPEETIREMYFQQEVPRINVDCDDYIFVGEPLLKEKTKLEGINSVDDLFKLISPAWKDELAMVFSSHDTPYHKESIDEHINMTTKECIQRGLSNHLGLFHDLGKGITKRVVINHKDTHKNYIYIARYLGHANVSASYYLNFLYNNYVFSGEEKYILDNIEIIYQHMNQHQGMGLKNIKNNKLSEELLKKLEKFGEIDSLSRISEI